MCNFTLFVCLETESSEHLSGSTVLSDENSINTILYNFVRVWKTAEVCSDIFLLFSHFVSIALEVKDLECETRVVRGSSNGKQ